MGCGSINHHRKRDGWEKKRENWEDSVLEVETAPPSITPKRRPLADDEGEIAEPPKPKPGWRSAAAKDNWRTKAT